MHDHVHPSTRARVLAFTAAAFCVAAGGATASAQLVQVFGNVTGNASTWDTDENHAAYIYGGDYGSSSYSRWAVGFTPSQTVTFTAAVLVLDSFVSVGNTGTVSLHADAGGIPGAVLFSSVTQPTNNSPIFAGAPSTNGVFAGPSDSIMLDAGSTYWISLRVDELHTRLRWYGSATDISSPLAYQSGSSPWFAQQSPRIAAGLIVYGTAVPAPSAAAALASAGLLALRRRR